MACRMNGTDQIRRLRNTYQKRNSGGEANRPVSNNRMGLACFARARDRTKLLIGPFPATVFWLNPVVLASNSGMTARDLNRVRAIILEYQTTIREAWHEHCSSSRL